MKALDFPERTVLIAEHQDEYETLPAFVDKNDPGGQMIFCWGLSWKERLTLLFTGRLYHSVLTCKQPLQPQRLFAKNPFNKIEANCTNSECGHRFVPLFRDVIPETDERGETAVCPKCYEEARVTGEPRT